MLIRIGINSMNRISRISRSKGGCNVDVGIFSGVIPGGILGIIRARTRTRIIIIIGIIVGNCKIVFIGNDISFDIWNIVRDMSIVFDPELGH